MSDDNPIGSRAEDRLGRARFADELAVALRAMNADRGVVVGLMAPWRCGKTLVLNLVAEQLATEPKRTVLTFNPWMFSGSDQLVHASSSSSPPSCGSAAAVNADSPTGWRTTARPSRRCCSCPSPACGWPGRARSLPARAAAEEPQEAGPITVQRDKIEQGYVHCPNH